MELASLSDAYYVRRLGEDDIEPIFDLCRKHELFYRYHPPLVTRESTREYPDPDVAFIGFLMVDSARQGQGVGSKIVADCADYPLPIDTETAKHGDLGWPARQYFLPSSYLLLHSSQVLRPKR